MARIAWLGFVNITNITERSIAMQKTKEQINHVRLIKYDSQGFTCFEANYPTIEQAIKEGYQSMRDFLVCEMRGQCPWAYWHGRQSDKIKKEFFSWPEQARARDKELGFS
jgi:hypothetical protein